MEENSKNNKRTQDEKDKPKENSRSHSDMIDEEVPVIVPFLLPFFPSLDKIHIFLNLVSLVWCASNF